MKKDKSPVKLKERALKNGSVSLYLDTYQNGKHYYEFLKLYIIPERTAIDKERNKVTRLQAEAHRARRVIELQNGIYGKTASSEYSKITLTQAIDNKMKTLHGGSRKVYVRLKKRVSDYGDVYLQRITKHYVLGFIDFLKSCKNDVEKENPKPLKDTTISILFNAFNAVLNKAKREGDISSNPVEAIQISEKPHTKAIDRKCYLTLEELRAMAKSDKVMPELKRAFFFACHTALRISDIRALTYADIHKTDNGYQIEIMQTKTKDPVIVPLSKMALKLLGEIPTDPRARVRKVFKIGYGSHYPRLLRTWAESCGITKHITFHTSRHTAATLLLTYGADIYTTSKILGHASIRTTQIYAEIVNEKKIAAIQALPEI